MLNGWKAIAAYLKREERTAMRWAAERGMPVHRAPGPGRGSVYALAEEIDAWFATNRLPPAEPLPPEPPEKVAADPPAPRVTRRRWLVPSLAAVGGAALLLAGAHHLGSSRGAAAVPATFADPAAKAMYLQATYDWNLRTRDGLQRAIREYGEVIARDPRVPDAYIGLANCYLLLRENGSMPDADAYTRAEAAAQVARDLAPRSPEVHRALGFIAYWWHRDNPTTRREFAQAIALRPDDALTHHWFATALLNNGEAQAALREIDIARSLDPTEISILADRALMLFRLGRREEAHAVLDTLVHQRPDMVRLHRVLAEAALAEGRPEDFLRESATVARLRGNTARLAELARWRSAPGPLVTTMLREATSAVSAAGGRTGWFEVAQLASLAGRRDEADQALARACASAEPIAISDPWLAHSLPSSDIAERCSRSSLLA